MENAKKGTLTITFINWRRPKQQCCGSAETTWRYDRSANAVKRLENRPSDEQP
jgi:hypothetical protein